MPATSPNYAKSATKSTQKPKSALIDFNFLSDPKIQLIIEEMGPVGLSYFMALWAACGREGGYLDRRYLGGVARSIAAEKSELIKFIDVAISCELMAESKDGLFMPAMIERLEAYQAGCTQRSEAGKKSAEARARHYGDTKGTYADTSEVYRDKTKEISNKIYGDTTKDLECESEDPKAVERSLNARSTAPIIHYNTIQYNKLDLNKNSETENPPPQNENSKVSQIQPPNFSELESVREQDRETIKKQINWAVEPHMTTGRRQLKKYPEIWITVGELSETIRIYEESGVNHKLKDALLKCKSKLLEKPPEQRERVNSYIWLTGWILKEITEQAVQSARLENTQKPYKATK